MELFPLLGKTLDLALIIFGFGAIVFIHELGHFLAARWAGIRVLTFAVGLGNPLITWRKGVGFSRRSTERDYRHARAEGDTTISPTEYRLNALPFGGYVKMLGQEDLNPGARSEDPDSYQNCPVWKRMIVLSAGVVFNVISAGIIFVVVFSMGISHNPAVIGALVPGGPAERAGLLPGDEILDIDGVEPDSFTRVAMKASMASATHTMHLVVDRRGERLEFDVKPERSPEIGLLDLGIYPASSNVLANPDHPDIAPRFRKRLDELGLQGVPAGSTLESVNGIPVRGAYDLAIPSRDGDPLHLVFSGGVERTLDPAPEFQQSHLQLEDGSFVALEHLLGLTPVMAVLLDENQAGYAKGLRDGDVFIRLGDLEFPREDQGILEIRRHAGRTIDALVLRPTADGHEEVPLALEVSPEGTIGFGVGTSAQASTLLSATPRELHDLWDDRTLTAPASSLPIKPGNAIVRIGDTPVSTFPEVRAALREATSAGETEVPITFALPLATEDGERLLEEAVWTLADEDVETLRNLTWTSPLPGGIFEPAEVIIRTANPVDALAKGIDETGVVMGMTYLTFARLFEGTVKVTHLKGPVGIAHIGTLLTDRGLAWVLFFLAVISINLAVVNFLPLPILDGGQMVLLLYEQIRGRPAPIVVQNIAALIGLALIGTVFLVITFNDIRNLF